KAVLYTTIEPKNGIKLLTTDGLIQENIESMNGTHWTKVLIHGWEAFGGSSWPQDFLDAYMFDPERSVPYNIIVIEWLRAKNLTPFNWSLYITKVINSLKISP
ncbi:hypothetical protein DD595_26355, partial [Enterobacter cloacae complex sp. 4DZ3-17B2]|uniref:hypothetical protein n=1 Tax=Enterobacter cloacae complex sp. 4DZ3-17B2 TaxID=2511990 RepID=UPI001025A00D